GHRRARLFRIDPQPWPEQLPLPGAQGGPDTDQAPVPLVIQEGEQSTTQMDGDGRTRRLLFQEAEGIPGDVEDHEEPDRHWNNEEQQNDACGIMASTEDHDRRYGSRSA